MHVKCLLRSAVRTVIAVIIVAAFGGGSVVVADDKPAPPSDGAAKIEPFKLTVGDGVLCDLQERLSRTRWTNQIDGTAWEYGVPLDYMKDLVKYWQSGYDWRKQEAALNKLDQFVTRIDGLDIHFVHVRSK